MLFRYSINHQIIKKLYFIITSVFWILWIEGCATYPRKESKIIPVPQEEKLSYEEGHKKEKGIYHRVKKGETLWRIAKLYRVDLEKIKDANNLNDTTKIFQGQLLYIPTPYYKSEPKEFSKKDFIWPVRGKVVSFFGTKRTDGTVNRGIDIIPEKSRNVLSTKKGKVIFISEKVKGFGKTIIIEHEDSIYSIYGNNSTIFVKRGQEVQQGELIAEAKNDVFHFEIRKEHIPQNPLYFLP